MSGLTVYRQHLFLTFIIAQSVQKATEKAVPQGTAFCSSIVHTVPIRFSDDFLQPLVERVAGAGGGGEIPVADDMLPVQRHAEGRGADRQEHRAGLDLRRRRLLLAEIPAEGYADAVAVRPFRVSADGKGRTSRLHRAALPYQEVIPDARPAEAAMHSVDRLRV